MDVTDIKQLALLARIDIDDAEAEGLLGDMKAIIAYVDQVTKAPIAESVFAVPEQHNIFREDVVTTATGSYTEALLAEVPQTQDGYVKVKKIL